ncbi:MAG: leucine-rich repeat protein, partial [Clostridia bacterium]|nr:leucine-rich repeat protein [Clostridia bacterium]
MKNIKKAISLILSLMLVLGSFGVLTAYANATLEWDESTGTLSIHGNGNITREMVEEAVGDITNIKKVIMGNGITEIGGKSFLDCVNLEYIELSESLTYIGLSAFSGCDSLQSVIIPSGVEKI